MKFVILTVLFGAAMAADMAMNLAGGAYNFNYNTGDSGAHSRAESGSGSSVAGSYSYIDPNGDRRTVSYTAGPDGFKPSGDISVDRKTAAEAAAIAALAPKAPIAPVQPAAPVYPYGFNPYYGGGAYFSNVAPGMAQYMARW